MADTAGDTRHTEILIIGSGPIIIGQACEFDYSGAQACKALMDEGYRVILVNSNPATIMTDPSIADSTYIEPLTPEIVEKIISEGELKKNQDQIPEEQGELWSWTLLDKKKRKLSEHFK